MDSVYRLSVFPRVNAECVTLPMPQRPEFNNCTRHSPLRTRLQYSDHPTPSFNVQCNKGKVRLFQWCVIFKLLNSSAGKKHGSRTADWRRAVEAKPSSTIPVPTGITSQNHRCLRLHEHLNRRYCAKNAVTRLGCSYRISYLGNRASECSTLGIF
jgi:hypothetical protein